MSGNENLTSNRKKYLQHLVDLREFLALVVFFVSFSGIPLTEPDLLVTYKDVRITHPANVRAAVKELSGDDPNSVIDKYFESQQVRIVEFTNNSDKPITNIEFSVVDSLLVGGVYGFSTSAILNQEMKELVEFEITSDNALYFSKFTNLPQRSKIRFEIYGKFKQISIFSGLKVSGATKSIVTEEVGEASGFWLYVQSNSYLLFTVAVAITLMIGFRRKQGTHHGD